MQPDRIPFVSPVYRPGTQQAVAFTAAAAPSAAIIGSGAVLLVSTQDCHIRFGATPIAEATDFLLLKNIYLAITCDGDTKISAIRDTADGTLYVLGID